MQPAVLTSDTSKGGLRETRPGRNTLDVHPTKGVTAFLIALPVFLAPSAVFSAAVLTPDAVFCPTVLAASPVFSPAVLAPSFVLSATSSVLSATHPAPSATALPVAVRASPTSSLKVLRLAARRVNRGRPFTVPSGHHNLRDSWVVVKDTRFSFDAVSIDRGRDF